MHRARWVPYAFLLPALAGLIVFRFVPIVVAFVQSLMGTTLMGDSLFVGFANYQRLVGSAEFWNSFKVTILFNVIATPVQIILAFALALLVFRPSRGIGFFRTAYFLPMTVSISITAILWNLLLDPNLGLVNGMLQAIGLSAQPFFRSASQALGSLIGIATWKGAGYWMLFLLAGLNSIPPTLYEAAAIDGAPGWRGFLHITLPLMKRPLGFVLAADTALNFLFFAPVYLITQGGPFESTNLLMYAAYRTAFVLLDIGRSTAISSMILLIIVIFTVVELRMFRSEVEL